MALRDRLAVVDALLARPFPETTEREGASREAWEGYRSSGPHHHVCYVMASRDFWDDRGEEVVEAAQAEIDAALQELATVLTTRWGSPREVDLWPYAEGEAAAPVPPLDELGPLTSTMLVWRRPDADRWVALAVGQADPEFPVLLLAAVGGTPLD
ncbi:hypothetical protein ABT158_44085 [Nonomuraea sp. NPDC001636]|uniref:hypothetical protein n=1 Tax=Nonomuraea sp. NPDC001636 TaxID=3154391 RepID=UPI0033178502